MAPSQSGANQERQLFSYLRFDRHCALVIEGDEQVRQYLGMRELHKCADSLGFHQPPGAAGPRRVIVAESKGTGMASAVVQLGNAAAGVYEKFGRETKIQLLVMVRALTKRPEGWLSPGGGYRAVPLPTGRGKYVLMESMGGPLTPPRPTITYPPWARWSREVDALRVELLALTEPN